MKRLIKKNNNNYLEELKRILSLIKENDINYDIRYGLVLEAIGLAQKCGYFVGLDYDEEQIKENNFDWVLVYIDLPTGQVSWHMPTYYKQFNKTWDKHTTEEKYERIEKFTK